MPTRQDSATGQRANHILQSPASLGREANVADWRRVPPPASLLDPGRDEDAGRINDDGYYEQEVGYEDAESLFCRNTYWNY